MHLYYTTSALSSLVLVSLQQQHLLTTYLSRRWQAESIRCLLQDLQEEESLGNPEKLAKGSVPESSRDI
jgi:hypothetical protein